MIMVFMRLYLGLTGNYISILETPVRRCAINMEKWLRIRMAMRFLPGNISRGWYSGVTLMVARWNAWVIISGIIMNWRWTVMELSGRATMMTTVIVRFGSTM